MVKTMKQNVSASQLYTLMNGNMAFIMYLYLLTIDKQVSKRIPANTASFRRGVKIQTAIAIHKFTGYSDGVSRPYPTTNKFTVNADLHIHLLSPFGRDSENECGEIRRMLAGNLIMTEASASVFIMLLKLTYQEREPK